MAGATYIVNHELVRKELEARGWTQDELATKADISLRTVSRALTPGQSMDEESLMSLGAVFQRDWRELILNSMEPRMRNEHDAFLRVASIAAYSAMWSAQRAFFCPWSTSGNLPTSAFKSTAQDPATDPTEPVDREATIAIEQVLMRAARTPGHPLSNGFLIHNEESGLNRFNGLGGTCDETLIVFVDPVDYTDAAVRGLDGSVLISFFRRGFGLCVAVVGDVYRQRIYYRKLGEGARAIAVNFPQDPASPFARREPDMSEPTGAPLSMATTGRMSLMGATVNIYMGKPDRIRLAADLAGALLEKQSGIKSVFSVGGSLGMVRVGEGTWDATVEVAKGFRPWDFCPGCFIAEGAGAHVVDLDGKPISFGPGLIREEHIRQRFASKESLEDCRQKFIVASTATVADQIRAKLGNKASGEARASGRRKPPGNTPTAKGTGDPEK